MEPDSLSRFMAGMLKDQILFQEESNSPPGAVPCLLASFRLTAFLKLANLPAQRDCSAIFICMPVSPSKGGQFLCLITFSLVSIVYSCPLYFETCASLFGRGKIGIGHFWGCHPPSVCHLGCTWREVKGASAWQHVFNGVIKNTLIERAPSLPRILLCNCNKYTFNDRCGIYILEMALRNLS